METNNIPQGLCVTERIGDKIKVECTCPECGAHQECIVKLDDYNYYKSHNEPAYKVFNYLTPAQREMFVSCLCNDCFIQKYGE